jgi:LPS-assembly lipoprotein
MKKRSLLVLAAALLLSACGFQLRGSYALPFDTLHIALPTSSELHAMLKRNIEASTKTRIVDDPKQAQAILSIVGDGQAKNILSLNPSGRVREFQLVRTVTYRLRDAAGRDWLPTSQVTIRRDFSFDDAQVLAKEAEEALLWRDMQNDIVQQLLRRLAAARPPAAEAPAGN